MSCLSRWNLGWRLGCTLWLGAASVARAQTGPAAPRVSWDVETPWTTTAEYARSQGIALSEIELARPTAGARQGDRLTLLVTLSDGGTRRQWLATLAAEALTTKERAMKPLPDDVIFTSTGLELRYPRRRGAVAVRFAGPFVEAAGASAEGAVRTTTQRVLVSPEHLVLGLDRYAEAALAQTERARVAGVRLRDLPYNGSGRAFSADELARGRRFVEIIRPTPDEERLIVGLSFALRAFLAAAFEVKPFREVLERVMVKPSAWLVLTGFGVNAFIQYDQDEVRAVTLPWLPSELPAYELPLAVHFNGRLALRSTLLMTQSRPPLQVGAGLLGVEVAHPVDAAKRLRIQVIAARPAAR